MPGLEGPHGRGLRPISDAFHARTGDAPEPLVAALVAHFTARATHDNNSSPNLVHTEMLQPSDSPLLREAAALITPKLVEFGVHLFGERLPWALKEMWVNVLDGGGPGGERRITLSFSSLPAQLNSGGYVIRCGG